MRAEDKPEKPGKPVGDKPGDKPSGRGEERRLEREVRRVERRRERIEAEGVAMSVETVEEFSFARPDPITRPDVEARRDRVTVVLPRERLGDLAEVIRAKYPERVSTDVLAEWVIERLDVELGS